MQALFNSLVLWDASWVSGANWKEVEETSLSSPKQIMHSTNALEHSLLFLKCMMNEHVFMNFVSLNKIPALINFEIWQNNVYFVN